MAEINLKIEQYEGPLDLLLALISKHKIDIFDIPIAEICEQYNEYLNAMQKMDMEIAGEFIVMASELMLIKSKMLLPKAETETEDPREKLAAMLAEYQRM
ncbi:MAG: segregation/condensation protein A, partial [Clostridia bacterium]|nr:segregation/condensation protein A [Clostridia bacterium]